MGVSTDTPQFSHVICIRRMFLGDAEVILESKGHVRPLGVVEVCGLRMDVGQTVRRFGPEDVERDKFLFWLARAAIHA